MIRVCLTPYDKNKVQVAKAVIPFLIILHHCYQLPGLVYFQYLGIMLVSFFFLMSGYGLMTSYMKLRGGYLENFFSKRILKVFIPYVLSLCAWLIYRYLTHGAFDIIDYFVQNNIRDWLPYTWFVWIIIAAYFVFWGIFRLRVSLPTKLLLMAVVSAGYYAMGYSLELPQFWYRSSFCIVLGMIWRYKEEWIFKFLSKQKVYFVFPIACTALFAICQKVHLKDITPLFACAVFAWLMYSLKYSKGNRVVSFLSKISYEVYLLQCIAISWVCSFANTTLLAIPLIFLIDIGLASLIQTLSGLVYKKLSYL